MARRRKGQNVDGVVFLDKAAGVSSNAALQQVRRLFDARKAGHTGSLDPLASGLLPVCLGEATKLSAYLLKADKRYRVTAAYGAATATGDAEGEVVARSATPLPDTDRLNTTLARFVGTSEQIPPMYSALKQAGKPLYKRARAGETVERAPRSIRVDELRLVERGSGWLTLDATVSAGTYIRTLVEDIAAALGGVGHVQGLRRTGVGRLPSRDRPMIAFVELEAAAAENRLYEHRWPLASVIDDWLATCLSAPAARAFTNGQMLAHHVGRNRELLRVYDPDDRLLGLGYSPEPGRLAPLRVFARPQ